MRAKVAICIPAYNAACTIREALDSLLSQSYADFEIIVSDNHSTDHTIEVVREYEDRGVRLVTCPMLPSKTGSLLDNCYSAIQNWNSLIGLTDADYIGIFHADDAYAGNLLEAQIDIFKTHPECSIVFSMMQYIDINGIKKGGNYKPLFNGEYILLNQAELIDRLANNDHFFSSSGVMIDRKKWMGAGKLDALKWGQQVDTEFWIRISGFGPAAIIDKPLVYYRLHENQDTSLWKKIYAFEYLPFLSILDHYVKDNSISPLLKKDTLQWIELFRIKETIRIGFNHLEINDREKAKEYFKCLVSIDRMMVFFLFGKAGKKMILRYLVSLLTYLNLKTLPSHKPIYYIKFYNKLV